jgi:tetratricopeptide (TPR) repeat protein
MGRGEYAIAVELFLAAVPGPDSTRPGSRAVVGLLTELGVACKMAGRFDEAACHYTRASAMLEELTGSDPAEPGCAEMADLLHNIGGLAHARQRFGEGVGPARRGLALRRRLPKPDAVAVALDRVALAALLEGVGHLAEAEGLYRAAVAVLDAAGEGHDAAMARSGLGSACQSLGRWDEAERHYRAALAQLDVPATADHPDLGHVLNNLATLHRRRGEDEEARALLARAQDLLERTLGPDHPVTGEVAANRRRVDSGPSPYVNADPPSSR